MTIVLNNDDVKAIFKTEMAIEAIENSYVQMTAGTAACRPSTRVQIPTSTPGETYQWGTTEGGSSAGYFAIRMLSDVIYQNEEQGFRTQEKYCMRRGTYCGLVFLFRVNNGEPLAILNDGYLQQMRVGVDAALGIKYMARKNARVIGMFGCGGLARSMIEAIRAVREIRKIQVYGPVPEDRDAYAREMQDKYGIETVRLDHPLDVYKGADILADCTNAVDVPIILGRHVQKGTHILSVGRRLDKDAYKKITRSLRFGNATAAIGKAEITDEHVTYMTPALARAAKKRTHSAGFGANVSDSKIIFFKDILKGRKGRRSAADITYSERGNMMGAQFHAMAGRVYELAKAKGLGREIPTEWFLENIRN